ncbi:DUF305 domain-containing protein [Nocardia fluminea]|uniref:Uncharacterized protein (DUF305 family) n=1 Tax=Nocardia fluminea TaxID=134984 RepID=A0A2N3VDR4_9NOCA|nr:DUF305 domain-containing protein [Nocardia fluminea]PKV79758.1 uncharacterized protein (DUF305 family) [Nocardia fluminea]
MSISRTHVLVAAAATVLLAAGCSDDSTTTQSTEHSTTTTTVATSATASTDFNAADVSFLQMMYPHHAQAVEMAKMVPSHTQNQQLIALAAQVEKAQAPEMQQITDLLAGFGEPAPSATEGHGGHMPGMMTDAQMSSLQAANGADFDRQWLEMMIAHHEGAVEMARTELNAGVNSQARRLATKIVADQEAEITTMRGMLGQN